MGTFQGQLWSLDESFLDVYGQKSTTAFGDEIICVARYWANQRIIQYTEADGETWSKRGTDLEIITGDYFGAKNYYKRLSWCAIMAAYIVNEASRTLGVKNTFPQFNETLKYGNGKQYGNAQSTLDNARKNYRVDNKPTPGSVFYRYSALADNKISGHMGVVLAIEDGALITFEGNVRDENPEGSKGAGMMLYTEDLMVPSNGWQFIHTEEDKEGTRAKIVLPYRGQDCTPKIYTPSSGGAEKGGSGGYAGGGTGGGTGGNTGGGGGGTDTGGGYSGYSGSNGGGQSGYSGGQSQSGYSGTEEKKTFDCPKVDAPCKEVIIRIPEWEKLSHWGQLEKVEVAMDITGPKAAWNGAVFNGWKAQQTPSMEYTGFGLFRDLQDNAIWMIDIDNEKSRFMFYNGYIAPMTKTTAHGRIFFHNGRGNGLLPDCYIIPISANADMGNTPKTYKAQILANKKKCMISASEGKNIQFGREQYKGTKFEPIMERLFKDGGTFDIKRGYEKGGYLHEILNDIQNYPLDKPVVIYLVGENQNKNEALITALTMLLSVIPIFPKLNNLFPPGLIQKISGAVESLKSGNMDYFNLLQIANGILPESVKGFVDNKIDGIGKYLSNGYEALNLKDNFKMMEKWIGVQYQEIDKLYQYIRSKSNELPDFSKLTGIAPLDEVIKNVGNLTAMRAADVLARQVEFDTFKGIIGGGGGITSSPVMRQIFSSGQADTILASVGTMPDIAQILYGNPTARQDLARLINNRAGFNNTQASMIKVMTGFVPEKSAFNALAYQSMYEDAVNHSNQNKPYVLPAHLQECPDLANCYKVEIEKSTGAKVVVCPPGYTYDFAKNACMSKNAKVVVESGYGGNNGGGKSGYDYYSGYDGGNNGGKSGYSSGYDYSSGYSSGYDSRSGYSGTNTSSSGYDSNTKTWFDISKIKDILNNSGSGYSELIMSGYNGKSGYIYEEKGKQYLLPPCIQRDENGFYFMANGNNVKTTLQTSPNNEVAKLSPTVLPESKVVPENVNAPFISPYANTPVVVTPSTTPESQAPVDFGNVASPKTSAPVPANLQPVLTTPAVQPPVAPPVQTPVAPPVQTPFPISLMPQITPAPLPVVPLVQTTPFPGMPTPKLVTSPVTPMPENISGGRPEQIFSKPGYTQISPTSPIGYGTLAPLSDIMPSGRLRAFVQNQGTANEKWYVEWNGKIYDLDHINCIFTYLPDSKPYIQLPPCIIRENGFFYYIGEGNKYPAYFDESNKDWYVRLPNGYYYDLIDCKIIMPEPELPKAGITTTTTVPEPKVPEPFVPTIKTTIPEPKVPEPFVPTIKTTIPEPKVPEPFVPTIKTTIPEPKIPIQGYTTYNEFAPCNECDLKMLPAVVEETKKTIYSYPNDKKNACGGDCDCENDDCDCEC